MSNQNQPEVRVEKVIQKPASEVFRAIGEGRLFMNCGSDSASMQLDFKVGGKYRIDFKNYEIYNMGEFLEIVPNKKVVFSWCQTFSSDQKPDTQVTIELFPDGDKTKIRIVHTGFKDESTRNDHQGGWESGLTDLIQELQLGKIRMVRVFEVPVAKLYDTCKDFSVFFSPVAQAEKGTYDFRVGGKYCVPSEKGEVKGEYLEIIPLKKLVFSWASNCGADMNPNSKVTLIFDEEDDGGSSLELLHDSLDTEEQQKRHRAGWEIVTGALLKRLSV